MAALEHSLQQHLSATHAIQSEITGGGMSRVFIAEDLALKRRVVVKVLNPTLAATVSVARFQREIMLVARLNHPNIVPVLSAGEVESYPYFIMPYIEGESLRSRMVRGPLSIRETVLILKDVARALAYAHSAGIVHRDIKPDNILLAGSAAVVTDFGVAKAVTAARDKRINSGGEPITGIGISMGTPQYMAPEQAAADPNADSRVDLYALGIVAYEMLLGSPPFHGRTPQKLLAAQLTELPAPIASRRADVPVALADLIMQCLEKDPADRPRSAGDVGRELDNPDVISGPLAALPGQLARRRLEQIKSMLWVMVPAVFVVLLIIWTFAPQRPATSPTTTTGAAAARTAATPAPTTVRIARPAMIGPHTLELGTAIAAALQTSLVRAGYTVVSGESTATQPGFVVQTTVQQSGARSRANVQLLRDSSQAIVWSDQIDFRSDDSFAAQDSVGAHVVRALRTLVQP